MPSARLVAPEPGVEALHPRAHVATVAAHAPSRKSRREVLSVMPFPPKGDAGVDPKTIRKPLPMPNNLKCLWCAGVVVGNQNQRATGLWKSTFKIWQSAVEWMRLGLAARHLLTAFPRAEGRNSTRA